MVRELACLLCVFQGVLMWHHNRQQRPRGHSNVELGARQTAAEASVRARASWHLFHAIVSVDKQILQWAVGQTRLWH